MIRNRRAQNRLWQEIRRVATADLALVADEIRALEDDAELGARDPYYRAVGAHARAESKLASAKTLPAIRQVARLAATARYEIAVARALIAGEEPPAEHPPCFFDPAHGPSARAVAFAPSGGPMENVPACGACAEQVDAGSAPASRKAIVDGRPQSYWRSPAHVGYLGHHGDTVAQLLVLNLDSAISLGDAGLGLIDWIDWAP